MRKPVLVLAALASVVVLGACQSLAVPGGTAPAVDSGIDGQVFIGPMCPVIREGEPCPDQPFQATITILNANGKEVARVESDAQGRFLVNLAPGTYTLRPEPGEGIAHAEEQSVTVSEGQYAQVVVSYDSGIR